MIVDNKNMSENSTILTYAAGVYSLFIGVFTFQNILALVGVVVAVATFFVNRHYRKREDLRKQETHDIEMRRRRLELQRMEAAK